MNKENNIFTIKEGVGTKINDSKDIFNIIKKYFSMEREEVYFIGVNTKNKIKHIEIIGIGDLNSSIVSSRIIYKRCYTKNLSGFFLVHNHPSEDLNPSIEDNQITKKLNKQCEILGLRFLDHIIYSDKDFYSMYSNNIGGFE